MRIRLNHKRLLELMVGSKRSQNHWAMRLGLSKGHWSGIVKGKHPYPSAKTRSVLLEAFGVPFDELFQHEVDAGADADFQSVIADRYLIESEIGQGGMGTVYAARDVRLARRVAIKVISPEAVCGIGAAQFLREVRYTAGLRHHNILPIFDAGEAAGFPYFVMPFLTDGSLRDAIKRRGPFPVRECVSIISGVADALDAAHASRVLHCDIKPENILMSGLHPFVADFGISRAIHAESFEWGRRSEIDSSAGTPAYVSPEQASGERDLDARSDVYSLACVAYEMLSGFPPFQGTTTMEVVAKRFVETPDLRRLVPHVGGLVADVVKAGMALSSAHRPASARAFAESFANAASVARRGWVARAVVRARLAAARGKVAVLRRLRSHQRKSPMSGFVHDVRFAARSLFQSRSFALIAVMTLALGIGANAAIFSVVNIMLIQSLPFPDSERVMVLYEVNGNGGADQVSPPNFKDWRDRTRSFQEISFSSFYGPQSVLGAGLPTRASVEAVGANFFRVFGVEAMLGRTFSPDDEVLGANPTIVLGHRFWSEHFAGDSLITQSTVEVGGTRYQVIGVMPDDFRYQGESDVWIPAERTPLATSRTTHALRVIGKLHAGVELADARGEMNDIAQQVRSEAPEASAVGVRVLPLKEQILGDTERPLTMLMGAAALLLLIACTNIASTFLARGAARQREFSLRTALGANRWRIVRQLLAESSLVALVGGGVGVLIGVAIVRVFKGMAPSELTLMSSVRLDGAVIVFCTAVTVFAVALFGIIPALQSSVGDPADALRGRSGDVGRARRRMWASLVAVEVALAFVLLIGTTLLMQSFWRLMNVDAGFDPGDVLTFEMSLPPGEYQDDQSMAVFYSTLLLGLQDVPGVDDVGIINHLPLSGASMFTGIRLEAQEDWVRGNYRLASSGYFSTLHVPMLRGRSFNDRANIDHEIIVNQRLADVLWPDADPIGQRVMLSGSDLYWADPLTVVGVVADVRHNNLESVERETYYVNFAQRPTQSRSVVGVARIDRSPETVGMAIRQRVQELGPNVPVRLEWMTNRVDISLSSRRFTAVVLSSFGGLAVLLAVIGIFGVVSYGVARRNRELGIRIALGAGPSGAMQLIVAQSMRTVILGLGLGVVTAVLFTRYMRSLLFEVSPTNPLAFLVAALLLCSAALAASYVPARRAARIDPMLTMKAE